MKRILWICGCILNLPVDLIRLTLHAWQICLGYLASRFWYQEQEQRCPFCLDCDHAVVPRSMHRQIRYWNLWLIRLLLPHLRSFRSRNHIRKLPLCANDTGYLHNAWQAFVLALILTIGWAALIAWALTATRS